jgi:hypothetical protein
MERCTSRFSSAAACSLLLCCSLTRAAQNPSPPEAAKLVRIDAIQVSGTRLPADSVIRLSGLTVGQSVNDLIVNTACHKITSTGLVKTVDYGYQVYPDKPGAVLTLKLEDERPLFPAVIRPVNDDGPLWACLQSSDPLFTRELPRTERALSYYSTAIERCLKASGRDNEYASAQVSGDGQGNASQIVFEIRQYRSTPKTK